MIVYQQTAKGHDGLQAWSRYFISPARIMDWGFIKVRLRDLILTRSASKKNERLPEQFSLIEFVRFLGL